MTDIPATSKPAPNEVRRLLVHPAVWKSLEAWLNSVRIGVVSLPRLSEDPMSTYGMTPIDGEWGGPDAA